MSVSPSTLAKRLATARTNMGMTIEDVAEESLVPADVIRRIEQEGNPTSIQIHWLSKAYRVPLSQLLRAEE